MPLYKHIIISRVGVKWYSANGQLRCEDLGLTWDEWLKNSIQLCDEYCRPSLANQINQNFILLSIFDESVTNFGKTLPNEIIIKIKNMQDINKAVSSFIKQNVKEELFLLSRLDRDDCYSINFVSTLQNAANRYLSKGDDFAPYYFDIDHLNRYRPSDNVFSVDRSKYASATSPFTSVLISSPDVLFIYSGHNKIREKLNGMKLPNLETLQIIHDNNLLNKISGTEIPTKEINRKLLDFNIKKSVSWCIDSELYNWILYHVAKGSTILELGSGYKTIDLAKRYKMISIEDDENWLNLTDKATYIYAPIVDSWYDADILKSKLVGLKYDVILIDGPWIGNGDRTGFLTNIDLFNTNTIIIFDDTHRPAEKAMCENVSKKLGVKYKEYKTSTKKFAVIKNKQKHNE